MTHVGGSVTLSSGVATSTNFDTNTAPNGGTFCWRPEYSGNTIYNALTHTNFTSECFDLIVPQQPLARGPAPPRLFPLSSALVSTAPPARAFQT